MPESGYTGPEEGGADQQAEQKIVGRRLREARETLGLKQDDVAGALGIPRTSVVAMEAGRRNVTALELRRLARLYRRSVEWLLGETTTAGSVDNALYRATADLSEEDKEQILRFAQFLAAAGPAPRPGKRNPPPPPFTAAGEEQEQGSP